MDMHPRLEEGQTWFLSTTGRFYPSLPLLKSEGFSRVAVLDQNGKLDKAIWTYLPPLAIGQRWHDTYLHKTCIITNMCIITNITPRGLLDGLEIELTYEECIFHVDREHFCRRIPFSDPGYGSAGERRFHLLSEPEPESESEPEPEPVFDTKTTTPADVSEINTPTEIVRRVVNRANVKTALADPPRAALDGFGRRQGPTWDAWTRAVAAALEDANNRPEPITLTKETLIALADG